MRWIGESDFHPDGLAGAVAKTKLFDVREVGAGAGQSAGRTWTRKIGSQRRFLETAPDRFRREKRVGR